MTQEDRFSAFYPMIIYPEHEQAARQGEMAGHLQTIVRELSRIGPNQPQTQIVQSRDQDASHQVVMSIDDLRESLGRDLGGLRNELGGLSSQLEWSIGLLHESIVEQTNVLLTIAKQQRIPTELKVNEYLTGAQEMMSQLANSIQSKRFNQNQIEDSFTAIDDRFLHALEPAPRASLMYAILLARAELYLLVKKDNEALAFLEQSLLYAPQDESFDYSSYSYRLMGRIVFTQGSSLKAEGYLGKAIHLSPRYAIAWYDRAQYLARLAPATGPVLATLSLRHAIEMNEGFMLLANIEPNFDPIRKDVDELIETIRQEQADDLFKRTEQLRQSHLATISTHNSKAEKIRAFYGGGQFKSVERLASLASELNSITWKRDVFRPILDGAYFSAGQTKRHISKLYNDSEIVAVVKLKDAIQNSESLESLQALDSSVAGFDKASCEILQQVEQLAEFWETLPGEARRYLDFCKTQISEYNAKITTNKDRLKRKGSFFNPVTLSSLEAERIERECTSDQGMIDLYTGFISKVSRVLREFEDALNRSRKWKNT